MKNYIFKNNFWKQVNLNSHNGLIYLNSGPNGLRSGPERSRLKICLFIQLLDSHTVSTKIVILRPSNHLWSTLVWMRSKLVVLHLLHGKHTRQMANGWNRKLNSFLKKWNHLWNHHENKFMKNLIDTVNERFYSNKFRILRRNVTQVFLIAYES